MLLDVDDPDGDQLTVIVPIDDPDNIVTAVSGTTMTMTTTAPGTFQVSYRVTDGFGESRLATVTVRSESPTTTTVEVTPTSTTTLPM